MLKIGTLCWVVGSVHTQLNGRVVEILGPLAVYGDAYWWGTHFNGAVYPTTPHGDIKYSHPSTLIPFSDPDNCTITDAEVYARQPERIA